MDLHEKYQLRRVLNAYDKATHLGGARLAPAVARVVSASLGECFFLDELQQAAGRAIAEATGSEWGCVTACAAAGITLGVAAAMTGPDLARVAQLPDPDGMPNRVIIQHGHCISFGTPVTQMIRLAGAEVVAVGGPSSCSSRHVRQELDQGGVAAIVAVESYHTSMYDGVSLRQLAELAHDAGVPLIIDSATQELRLRELVATGADAVIGSAHKYLGAATAGVVAGRRELMAAMVLQHQGIGRGMKVGKEGIVGVLAAFEAPTWRDTATWTANENRKVERILDALAELPGVVAAASPDPNGCPFLRVRLAFDQAARHTAAAVRQALGAGDPAVIVRCYGFDREAIYINATEMTDEEVGVLCERLREVLSLE